MSTPTASPTATRHTRTFAWVWILAIVLVALDVIMGVRANDGGGDLVWSSVLAVFTLSGALIVSRLPRNVIGWLLLVPGVLFPISGLAAEWLGAQGPPQQVAPLVFFALWFSATSWVFIIFPVLHLMLVFPTGRLLSPRWRWVVGLELTMLIGFLALAAFSENLEMTQGDEIVWTVPNPIGFVPQSFWDETFGPIWGVLLLAITVFCVAAVVVRFRRGTSVEREQMKWLLLAVACFGVVYGTQAMLAGEGPFGLADVLFTISLTSIPIAIAIAVLRYRLYDIDRIVSRTVSYALVVGVLAATFFGIVSLLTTLLPARGDLTVAASTLAVFAAFNPLRRRVQDVVDRRFNRSRYDSRLVMDAFASSLRDQVDADEVVDGWVGVVAETMQPQSVGVWLRSV